MVSQSRVVQHVLTFLLRLPACLLDPSRNPVVVSCSAQQRQSHFDSAEYFMGKEGKQPTDSFTLLASAQGSQQPHAFEALPMAAHTAKRSRLSTCAK
jgi:hypothetical protein